MRNKKAGMSVQMIISIALGLIILFILAYYGGGKIKTALGAAAPSCNSKLAKCACFYNGNICPSAYTKLQYNSESCPIDTADCKDSNYGTLTEKAVKAFKKDKNKNHLGTCCQSPVSKVSDTRLKSYGTT